MSDLNTLFEQDPLTLTDQDLDTIISALRQARVGQIEAEAVAKKTGKRISNKGAKPKLSKEQIKTLTLDDLMGDIVI